MTDYTLYYWPLPFRGEFVRAVLAHVGASWDEASVATVNRLRLAEPADQPVPHMGPPVLTDHAAGLTLAQMPAILAYLGRKHALMRTDASGEALTNKLIADANDVLYEMTRHNGAQMWTPETWTAYRPRLGRWMRIFEETGRHHGLSADAGTMLGTPNPGIADLATHSLWSVMTTRLPPLRPLLDEQAPNVAGLCDRIAGMPEQRELRRRSDAAYGEEWCSGQIETSLRAVLETG